MKKLQPFLAAPFVLIVLMFAAYSLGKSLEPFVPLWIVFLVMMLVGWRNSPRCRRDSRS